MLFFIVPVLFFVHLPLDEESDTGKNQKACYVGPVGPLDRESLLDMVGHSEGVHVATCVTVDSDDDGIGSKERRRTDHGKVVDEEGEDRGSDGTADTDHPEEPVLLGPGKYGLIEHKATDEATPSSQEGCANFHEIAEKETDDDSAHNSDTKEDPEGGHVGFAAQEDSVVEEAGHEHGGQEASEAHGRADQLASKEGEHHTGDNKDGTEVCAILSKVLPKRADIQNTAAVLGDEVDVGVAIGTLCGRVVFALGPLVAVDVDGEGAGVASGGARRASFVSKGDTSHTSEVVAVNLNISRRVQ